MNMKRFRKGCMIVLACYIVLAVGFYWIAGDQLRYQSLSTDAVHAAEPVGELVQGMNVRQPFIAQADELSAVSMLLSTYARENTSHLEVSIEDVQGEILAEAVVPAADIEDNIVRTISFVEPALLRKGAEYALVLTSPDGQPGNAITPWMGSTMMAGRGEVALELPRDKQLEVNGAVTGKILHFQLQMKNDFWVGQYYWYLAAGGGLLLGLYLLWLVQAVKKQKNILGLRLYWMFQRYGFLVKQLVARDFKTRYKRSILGVCWSFLNPLLTMTVQYVVFSTLFRSDVPNYALYLLSGIVCYNFFSESTGLALTSITGNAALITKVYVPKYIYPVSRVLSSTVNLLLSLIPLLFVMIISGVKPRPAILLLPFGLSCLLVFCIGMGFLLSTLMVFFRDTQFLWSVISMLWMYMTPIFYPESIIPQQYMTLYKCNPLYHIIRFIRCILIDGVSPAPRAYLYCLVVSFVPLVVGAIIFKTKQDKFILNL